MKSVLGWLLIGLQVLSVSCMPKVTVHKELERGAAKVFEQPVDADASFEQRVRLEGRDVIVELVPRRCVTVSEVSVKTTEVTRKEGSDFRVTALLYGLAALMGVASYAAFSSVPDRPKECPEGEASDDKCITKSGAQVGGATAAVLGAAFATAGTWPLVDPRVDESKKELGTDLARTESAPHACALGDADRVVELRMPGGQVLNGTLDAGFKTVFSLQDDWFHGLRPTATAALRWRGQSLGAVELAPAVRAYWAERGVQPGVVTDSSLVGASGNLADGAARIEVSVSPQDGTGAFVGGELDAGSFSLSDVFIQPVGGGTAIPLPLSIDRVETLAPKTGAASAVLLFDSSGSMRQNDPGMAGRTEAAKAFVDAIQGSIEVAVLDFGVGRSDALDASRVLQPFTSDRAAIETALGNLRSDGDTPLYQALGDALTFLDRDQRAGAIVLLTDGQARGNHQSVIEAARAAAVPIYAVGLGGNLDFAVLRDLGVETGGAFVDAADRSALAQAFRGVGTGVAVGQVRLRASGNLGQRLPPGAYDVRGKVLTTVGTGSSPIAHPFGFRTRVGR